MKRMFLFVGLVMLVFGVRGQEGPSHVFDGEYGLQISNTYTFNDSPQPFSQEWTESGLKIVLFDNELSINREIFLNNVYFSDDGKNASEKRNIVSIRNGVDVNCLFKEDPTFTQTLFNDDDKLEFLVLVYRKDEAGYKIIRFEIISEDGEVLGTFLAPKELENANLSYVDELYFFPFSLGNNRYLSWRYQYVNIDREYNSKIAIYKLDEDFANKVSLQRVVINSVSPNPIKRNETLTIKLNEEIQSTDSYIQVTDMSGKVILRQSIDIHTTEIKVPATQLTQGQCIYTIVSGGKTIDQGKIICREATF